MAKATTVGEGAKELLSHFASTDDIKGTITQVNTDKLGRGWLDS